MFPIRRNLDGAAVEELDAGPAWSKQEENLFIQGLVRYSTDFARVAAPISERTADHCKAFYFRERQTLRLDQYGPPPPVTSKKKGKKGVVPQPKGSPPGSEWYVLSSSRRINSLS